MKARESFEAMIAMFRASLSPEELERRQKATEELHEKLDREMIERHRCSECGVDTLNYSHSFQCSWRGVC